jgi:sRNA-binding carbon storage regulator CsrA
MPGESVMVGEAKITIGKNGKFYVDAPKRVRVIRCSVLERMKNAKKENSNQEGGEKA